MAAIKFFTDEHIAKAVANGLRHRGIDVLRASEVGMLGASDRELFDRARAEGRVFVTHDGDFLKLASQTPGHAGIAFSRQHTSVSTLLAGLLLIHAVLESAEIADHVEFIS